MVVDVLYFLLNYRDGPVGCGWEYKNKMRAATDEGWSAGHLLPVRSIPAAGREFTLLRESQVWYSTPLVCFRQLWDPEPLLADPDLMPDLPIQAQD